MAEGEEREGGREREREERERENFLVGLKPWGGTSCIFVEVIFGCSLPVCSLCQPF
jgi:hypothetical protein